MAVLTCLLELIKSQLIHQRPSKSVPMINGLKVVEGSVIEGVKVVEIHPTSVRLLHNNRYLEISMPR